MNGHLNAHLVLILIVDWFPHLSDYIFKCYHNVIQEHAILFDACLTNPYAEAKIYGIEEKDCLRALLRKASCLQ